MNKTIKKEYQNKWTNQHTHQLQPQTESKLNEKL